MVKFILENSDDTLTTHSGLGLIGLLLSKTKFHKRFSSLKVPEIKSSPKILNGDVTTSYVGLLCQGKNDFDHIEIPSFIVHWILNWFHQVPHYGNVSIKLPR